MPPKTGKGKQEAAAAFTPEAPPPPDPHVLLYLQASSRAFPRVSQYLRKQEAELAELVVQSQEATTRSQQAAKNEVSAFAVKRIGLEAEVVELEQRKRELQSSIDAGRAAFDAEYATRQARNTAILDSMQADLDHLQRDSVQAENWSYRANGQTRELESLDAKIEEKRALYAAEIEKMHADHEADKRRMRDALVRRLRRARDFMTSSWGNNADDSATTGATDLLEASAGGGGVKSGAATARVNEELSRELSIREREAVAQLSSIKDLEETHAKLAAELEQEQTANTQLLLRNASYTKTRRVLEAKLSELKSQLATVLDRRNAHEKDRLAALRGTVAMQATVINELNSEIDLHISELASLNKRLRSTRSVLSHSDARVANAMRFLWALSGPRQLELQDPVLEPSTPGPSGGSAALVPVQVQEALVVPSALWSDVKDCSSEEHLTGPKWTRIRDRRHIVSFLMSLVVGGTAATSG